MTLKERHTMNNSHFWTAVSAFGLGALMMYIFDPKEGRRRRALARDQLASAQRQIGEKATATYQDLRNRAYGLYAEARSTAGKPLAHSDEVTQPYPPESIQHLGR
jgi:hypothetical protein